MPSGNRAIGCQFYSGRAKLSRKVKDIRREDFDGVECFCLILPLVPLRPVHVWGWGMDEATGHAFSSKRVFTFSFRSMPIRWSWYVVVRAMLRWWLWLPTSVALLLSFCAIHGVALQVFSWLTLAALLAVWVGTFVLDARDVQIRCLLGRHRLGYSDPATWTPDLVELAAPPQQWFGTATFAEAVELRLRERRYCEAMWAARLCLAVESETEGRRLTDYLLGHPEVRAVLAQLKAEPRRFKAIVGLEDERPYPLLRAADGRAADYWRSMIDDGSKLYFYETAYAQSYGGMLAWSSDWDEEEVELEGRNDPPPPKGQLGPDSSRYRLGGAGVVAGSMLVAVALFGAAVVLNTRKLNDFEQQVRAANPHATPAQPGRQWDAPEAGNWRFLADLPEFDVKHGECPVAKDGTLGDAFRSPIKVGGFPSPKGLGMHPKANDFAAVKYRLGRAALRLKGVAALNDTVMIPHSAAYFEVWGDDKRLWRSPPLNKRGESKECDVDVEGIDVLELRAGAEGDNFFVHAVWLGPKVLMK